MNLNQSNLEVSSAGKRDWCWARKNVQPLTRAGARGNAKPVPNAGTSTYWLHFWTWLADKKHLNSDWSVSEYVVTFDLSLTCLISLTCHMIYFHQLTDCQVSERQCTFREFISTFDFLVDKRETPDFMSCIHKRLPSVRNTGNGVLEGKISKFSEGMIALII